MEEQKLMDRTEHFLRRLYEDGEPLGRLLDGTDAVDFSWVGPDRKEYFDNSEALARWWEKEGKDGRERLAVSGLAMTVLPAGAETAAVLASWRLTGEGAERRERGTFVYLSRGGRPLLAHLHISRPQVIVWPEGGEGAKREASRLPESFLPEPAPAPHIPVRQRRVLRCLREGLTYKEIGEVLGISPRTVRYYVSELIHRFRVENKAQLLAASRRLALGDGPSDEKEDRP